jgi:hypothetical protein
MHKLHKLHNDNGEFLVASLLNLACYVKDFA